MLRFPFFELDKQVERDSGVTLTIIFGLYGLYGLCGYRRMEREALESILKQILRGTIIYK
jgi:shikimate kinase